MSVVPEDTPSWLQIVIAAGVFIFSSLAAILGKIRSQHPSQHPAAPEPANLVVAGAAIADMQPVRDLGAAVTLLAGQNKRMADAQERQAELLQAIASLAEKRVASDDTIARAHQGLHDAITEYLEATQEREIRRIERDAEDYRRLQKEREQRDRDR